MRGKQILYQLSLDTEGEPEGKLVSGTEGEPEGGRDFKPFRKVFLRKI